MACMVSWKEEKITFITLEGAHEFVELFLISPAFRTREYSNRLENFSVPFHELFLLFVEEYLWNQAAEVERYEEIYLIQFSFDCIYLIQLEHKRYRFLSRNADITIMTQGKHNMLLLVMSKHLYLARKVIADKYNNQPKERRKQARS